MIGPTWPHLVELLLIGQEASRKTIFAALSNVSNGCAYRTIELCDILFKGFDMAVKLEYSSVCCCSCYVVVVVVVSSHFLIELICFIYVHAHR